MQGRAYGEYGDAARGLILIAADLLVVLTDQRTGDDNKVARRETSTSRSSEDRTLLPCNVVVGSERGAPSSTPCGELHHGRPDNGDLAAITWHKAGRMACSRGP